MTFCTQKLLVWIGILGMAVSPAFAQKILKYNVATEPETLDPTMLTGIPEATITENTFEELVRVDYKTGVPEPRVAERWDISEDGLTYTFHLRDTNWSDGQPVTAHDFVYAYRRMLDPATAAEYGIMLYYIDGAEEYNSGKLTDPEKVGVRAIDDKTLEIRLAAPAPHFVGLLSHHSYMPIPKHIVEKNPNWATSPETYASNGPFLLTEWRHHDRLIFKKNPNHWNAANVKLDGLIFRTIEATSTELAMYETGELDVTYQVPAESVRRLRSSPEFHAYTQIATYYVCFNTKRRPFDDPRVRRAFSLAIDRGIITEHICQAGEPPAYGMVPPGILDADGKRDFREVGGDLFKSPDIKEAQRLMAEAGYPRGRGFPRVSYVYNDDERHRKIGMVLQNQWKRNLGVTVNLRVEEWKVLLANRRAGNYDFCRHGWVGDYADPMTFLDIFLTGRGLNDSKWSNEKYDALIGQARVERDGAKRMDILHKAEGILMDEMPVAPLFFYKYYYMQKPYVKGFVRTPLGYVYFEDATIEK